MVKENFNTEIEVPEGVTVELTRDFITVKGGAGELKRELIYPKVEVKSEPGKIVLSSEKATKREIRIGKSMAAHFRNMVKGAVEPFKYTLKICSGHFPMTTAVSGNQFTIKNFLGEKHPRVLTIKEGAKVEIKGDEVIVEAADKELAGQVAADIELLTTVRGRDLRIFQDGIYITDKNGKKI